MVTGVVDALDSVTVKAARAVPVADGSAAVTLPTETLGGVTTTGALVLVMVPVAVAVVRVAPEGLDSVTVNVSLASTAVSARTGTLICWEVTPGAKVRVPVVAV